VRHPERILDSCDEWVKALFPLHAQSSADEQGALRTHAFQP